MLNLLPIFFFTLVFVFAGRPNLKAPTEATPSLSQAFQPLPPPLKGFRDERGGRGGEEEEGARRTAQGTGDGAAAGAPTPAQTPGRGSWRRGREVPCVAGRARAGPRVWGPCDPLTSSPWRARGRAECSAPTLPVPCLIPPALHLARLCRSHSNAAMLYPACRFFCAPAFPLPYVPVSAHPAALLKLI